MARSIAALAPLRTTCPGALSLAIWQTNPVASLASAATFAAISSSAPSSAIMAPSPTGTATCIACPRIFNKRAASAMLKVPAAASAEYSPSEWPATKRAELTLQPFSRSSTRVTASDTAIKAG
jgi:hypothetical protein